MPWAPQGLDRIKEWRAKIGPLPLVAIGGLTPERASGVVAAGADSLAVITDFMTAADPEARISNGWSAKPKICSSIFADVNHAGLHRPLYDTPVRLGFALNIAASISRFKDTSACRIRFKIDEPVEKGFRRIAREQLDIAFAELARRSESSAQATFTSVARR